MSRSHETEIEIDRPIDDVWRALTEGPELERWFAPVMKVTPGVGGHIFASWGPGMEGTQMIEVWEPGRHLRLTEEREKTFECGGSEERAVAKTRLVTDYFLETRGGKTVLRLVHSGFGSDAAWDGEYEGTKTGWAGFFRTLKHGLERHPGVAVKNVSLFHVATGMDATVAVSRLLASAGIEAEGPYYQGVAEDLNDALVTVAGSPKGDDAFLYVAMVLYGLAPEQAIEAEAQWKRRLEALS